MPLLSQAYWKFSTISTYTREPIKAINTHSPAQSAVNGRSIVARVEVGNKVDVGAGTGADSIDIDSAANEGRGKGSAIDLELGGLASVLSNLLANTGAVVGLPVAEVERNEDLHAIVGSRLISKAELSISVRVKANVQGKGVDAIGLGTLHISIVVAGAGTLSNNADLVRALVYCISNSISTIDQP